MRNLYLLFLSFCLTASLSATHYSSGYITYRHVGGQNGVPMNSYEVEVVVYRNLNTSLFLGTFVGLSVRNECQGSSASHLVPRLTPDSSQVHPLDPYGFKINLSHNCSDTLNDNWSLYIFRDTVRINAVCGNIRLVPNFSCCRVQKDNLSSASTSSTLVVYALLNTLNGPVSLPKPDPSLMIGRLCAGGLYELYGFPADSSAEDWRFEKAIPLNRSGGTGSSSFTTFPVPYAQGFTVDKPLPVDSLIGYQLDSITGVLRLKPTTAGLYAINLYYKQYDTVPGGAYVLSGAMNIETAILVDTNCYASVTSGPQL